MRLCSSVDNILSSFTESQNTIYFKVDSFLAEAFPNTSLFQVFKVALSALSFSDRVKLKDPLNWKPIHQLLTKSKKNKIVFLQPHILKSKREMTFPRLSVVQQDWAMVKNRSRKNTLNYPNEIALPILINYKSIQP